MAYDNDTADDHAKQYPQRKQGPRRVTVCGTGPASADGPEPRLETIDPGPRGDSQQPPDKNHSASARDRWIVEQKPPHY